MFLKLVVTLRLWTFLVGVVFSFTIGVWWCRYFVPARSVVLNRRACKELHQGSQTFKPKYLKDEVHGRNSVFIGVMTSQRFLTTRARAVYETWGKDVPGQLMFFAGKGKTTLKVHFPVVYLPVSDNVHPPQRKSLAMLKYIHDHFINKFQWFIRADDDVYVRTKRLSEFLASVDSSDILLLGQAGQGKRHEQGKLGLREGDNFCIGGPSIIISAGALKLVTPHLEYCSNNTVTSHEDTEIGRCLRNFAGVMCPWAYEFRELFHHIYENQEKAYHGSLDTPEINTAITLHPIKDPAYMMRLHLHYATGSMQKLDYKARLLRHRLDSLFEATRLHKPAKVKFSRKKDFLGGISKNGTHSWELFNTKQIFSLSGKVPSQWIHDSLRNGLIKVVRHAKRLASREGAMFGYHTMRITKDIIGYKRLHPVLGCQYIVSLKTKNIIKSSQRSRHKRVLYSQHRFKFQQPFSTLRFRLVPQQAIETVHFVVPLVGRLGNFRRFLASFETTFVRRDKNVKLLIVYFQKLKQSNKHKDVFNKHKKKYGHDVFHWLDVNGTSFQRGLALNIGSKYFGKRALLAFTDVDLVFGTEYLFRCRLNTKRGKQVYFPIMFSNFHPNITRTGKAKTKKRLSFENDAGAWRTYSYGPVCVYSDDVTAVRGFSTSIKGWGYEDVEFFEKFLKNGKIGVFRSPDLGLLHKFHKHAPCSPRSTLRQQRMCLDATTAYLSSSSSAVDYLFRKKYLRFDQYF